MHAASLLVLTALTCALVEEQNVALESRTIPNEIHPYTMNWSPKDFIPDVRKKTDHQSGSSIKVPLISTTSHPLDHKYGFLTPPEMNVLKNSNKFKSSLNSTTTDSSTKSTRSVSVTTTTTRKAPFTSVKVMSTMNTPLSNSSKPTRLVSRLTTKSLRSKVSKALSTTPVSVESETVDVNRKLSDNSRNVRTTLKTEPRTSSKPTTKDRLKEQLASTVKALLKIHKKTTTKPTTQTTTVITTTKSTTTATASAATTTTTPMTTPKQTTTPKTPTEKITSSNNTTDRVTTSKITTERATPSTTPVERTPSTLSTTLNESFGMRSNEPINFPMVTVRPMIYSSLAPIIIQVSPADYMYDEGPNADSALAEDPLVALSTPNHVSRPKGGYWSKSPIWYLVQPQGLRYPFPLQQIGMKPGFFLPTVIPVTVSDGSDFIQRVPSFSTISETDQNSSLPLSSSNPLRSTHTLPMTVSAYPSRAAYPFNGLSMYPTHPSQITHTHVGHSVYPTHPAEVTQSLVGPTLHSAVSNHATQSFNGPSTYPTHLSQTSQPFSSLSVYPPYPDQAIYPFNGPSMYSTHHVNSATTASSKPVVMTGVAYPIDDSDDEQTSSYNNGAGDMNQQIPEYSDKKVEDYDNDFEDGPVSDYPEEPKSVDYSNNYPNGKSDHYPDEEDYPENRSLDYPSNNDSDEKQVEYSDENLREDLPDGHEIAADSGNKETNPVKPADYLDDFAGGRDSYYIEDPPPNHPAFEKPMENQNNGWRNRGRNRDRIPHYSRRKFPLKNSLLRSKIDPRDPHVPGEERTTRGILSYTTERVAGRPRGPMVTTPSDRRNEFYDDILDSFPEYYVEPPNYIIGSSTQQISESQSSSNYPFGYSSQNPESRIFHTLRTRGPIPGRPAVTFGDGFPKTIDTLTYNPHRSWINDEFITAAPSQKYTRTQPITYGIAGSLNCSLFHNPPIAWSAEQLKAFGNNSRDSVALILNCGGRGVGRSDGGEEVVADRAGRLKNNGQRIRWDISAIPIPPSKPTVPAEGVEPRRIFSQESPEDIQFVTDLIESQQEYRRAHQVVEFDVKPKLRSLARKKAETQSTDTWLCSHKGYGCNSYWYPVNAAISPSDVATEWYAESENYDFSAEPDLQRHPYVGLFTQMIWRSTMEVGCGRFELEDEKKYAVVCLYSPPGNEPGKFLDNVFPVPPPENGEGIQLADGSARIVIPSIVLVIVSLFILLMFPT